MAETITLTTPVVPTTRTGYTLRRLTLDLETPYVHVHVRANDGTEVYAQWTGSDADAIMTALNTANLSTVSLVKRVFLRLVADGYLPAGTVSGTPS